MKRSRSNKQQFATLNQTNNKKKHYFLFLIFVDFWSYFILLNCCHLISLVWLLSVGLICLLSRYSFFFFFFCLRRNPSNPSKNNFPIHRLVDLIDWVFVLFYFICFFLVDSETNRFIFRILLLTHLRLHYKYLKEEENKNVKTYKEVSSTAGLETSMWSKQTSVVCLLAPCCLSRIVLFLCLFCCCYD